MDKKIEQINALLHELSTIRQKLTRIENILRTELGESVCGLSPDLDTFPYNLIFNMAKKHKSITASEIFKNHQSIFERHNLKIADLSTFALKLCEMNYLVQIPTKKGVRIKVKK